jgi:hypothetical protein
MKCLLLLVQPHELYPESCGKHAGFSEDHAPGKMHVSRASLQID